MCSLLEGGVTVTENVYVRIITFVPKVLVGRERVWVISLNAYILFLNFDRRAGLAPSKKYLTISAYCVGLVIGTLYSGVSRKRTGIAFFYSGCSLMIEMKIRVTFVSRWRRCSTFWRTE